MFICPGGKELRRKVYLAGRKQYEYKAHKRVCLNCGLRTECTRDRGGRTVKRHERQEAIEIMLGRIKSEQAKADIKTRTHLMERSFARSVRYGYKRARWRRLWRVQIQEYMTASIQNLMILVKKAGDGIREGVRMAEKCGQMIGIIFFKYFNRLLNHPETITK